jgi:hypothetical protein
MASSPVVDQPCALKILGFTLGTILEMRGSTRGFSLGFVTWKKGLNVCIFLRLINMCDFQHSFKILRGTIVTNLFEMIHVFLCVHSLLCIYVQIILSCAISIYVYLYEKAYGLC